jgi:HPt (histidine-containing phosphotransfer) domain-containing protein
MAGIDIERGLATCAGKTELYAKLLGKFLHNYADFEQSFTDAQRGNDKGAPERLAHTLKGVAASIGATDLGELAGRLETDCRSGAAEESIAALLAKVVAALNIVLHSIESAGYGTVEVANGPDRQANPQQVTELFIACCRRAIPGTEPGCSTTGDTGSPGSRGSLRL